MHQFAALVGAEHLAWKMNDQRLPCGKRRCVHKRKWTVLQFVEVPGFRQNQLGQPFEKRHVSPIEFFQKCKLLSVKSFAKMAGTIRATL
jgi:hypothetical protein